MIVNMARRDGDGIVMERVDGDFLFEGGAAQEGVLVTFALDGRPVSGRVVSVSPANPDDGGGAGPVVEIELIDEAVEDIESEMTLASLPPDNDSDTKI